VQVAAQQKEIRKGQHELDALESSSSLLREQADQEHKALAVAQEKEALQAARMAELETEVVQQRNALRDAVSWAKSNTKQRMRSAESKRKDLQLQLDERRESESQLAQQELELRDLLEQAKSQSEQDLQALETRNMDLEAEVVRQREQLAACKAENADMENVLTKQREATEIEASAMQSVSALATDLAKQRDEATEASEARVKKLMARIKELEMLLEISKEFMRGSADPSMSLAAAASQMEESILSLQNGPPALSDELSTSKVARPKMLRQALRSSQSAGSLHANGKAQLHVLKKTGCSWPGRHLGPDEEGPVKVKFEEEQDTTGE